MVGCDQESTKEPLFTWGGYSQLGRRTAIKCDAAFAHLEGIHTLNMSHCNQATSTYAVFADLTDIHNLKEGNRSRFEKKSTHRLP